MLYSFTCENCKEKTYHEFKIGECNFETVVKCEKCEGTARRKIEIAPVQFSGSGFYCTESGVNPAGK